MGKYTDIQEKEIQEHHITLCPMGVSTCWGRTHAHVKERKICKWNQKNSIRSTFTLLHEIGHIETYKSTMRRVESEYYATQWASDECFFLGIEVPDDIRKKYQDYINMELDRGKRRGGTGYKDFYEVEWHIPDPYLLSTMIEVN